MMKFLLALTSLGLLLSACGGGKARDDVHRDGDKLRRMMSNVPQNRNFYFREQPDKNPSGYIGKFIPDNLPESLIDESQAESTACSKYIKMRQVQATGERSELISVSGSLMAGIASNSVMSAGANTSGQSLHKITYQMTDKWVAEIPNFEEFQECCQEEGCPRRYISEYIGGTYELSLMTAEEVESGGGVKGVVGGVSEGKIDEQLVIRSSEPTFFAFKLGNSPRGSLSTSFSQYVSSSGSSDADWCDNLPHSRKRTCFCGMSEPKTNEKNARDEAASNAKKQLSGYILSEVSGEDSYDSQQVNSNDQIDGKTTGHNQEKSIAVTEFVSRLRPEKAKVEKIEQPNKTLYVGKVLMCISKDAVEDLIDKLGGIEVMIQQQKKKSNR